MDDDNTFGLNINSHDCLIIEGSFYNFRMSRQRFTAWLVRDNVNIGMVQYLIGGDEVPTICDIEIRKEFRGNKLGTYLVKLVEEYIVGGTLYTSGCFTPEGYRSLGATIPTVPNSYEAPGVKFSSMDFVEDWEMFHLKH